MRGSITKRSKSSYAIVLNLWSDPTTGKRKQQWVSVKGTKKDAEKRLAELLYQLDNGTFMKPGKTTLAEYLERWLKDYAWPNLAPRTAEGYEHIMRRHLIPALGSMTLAHVKPEHLQRYYSEKLTGNLSAQTVRHHHTALHKALQTAVEWGLLNRNVADAVSPPRVQRPEMQTWSEEDIARFIEAAKDSSYYALFYTALFTGMRRSELLALRWQDVDLMLSQVYVSRSMHVLKGGRVIFRSSKTAKGRRTVALPPSAILLLKEHHEKQNLERAMLGIPLTNDDLVFSQFDGKSLLPNTVTHAWIKLVRRAGLKPIRLHDTRHSHASLMLKQGVHPKIVQERLGHASIQITLDTYSHVAPGLQQAAAVRFDEVFSARYNEGRNEPVEKFR
ncbi:MAG: site-specific integrase [Dehalococcoidales bacterium]|jgi:integrase|nr:site-specific integrase [Dehalococcoidales bacterium]MDP6576405.1 tyrosine-type recombinase/integrase [Dehalococcoidales bacterium]